MAPERPDRTTLSDEEIVRRIRAGETDSFGELVRRTQRQGYRLARRITRNHEDADDVLQDAYVKAFGALDRFQPGRPFGPWFYTIVARTALSRLRAGRTRAAESLDDPGPEGGASGHEQIPASVDDGEALDLRIDVERAYAKLSEEHRVILALRVEADLSYQAIADALDAPPGTVMSRLARAREALLEMMSEVKRTRHS
jgi:RNA polymerase sigma-70 factor (ECF subfamily)